MINKSFLVTGLLLFVTILISFNVQHSSSPNAKSIQQTMARINDSLYVCKYEVSNQEYRIFLADLKDALLAEKYKIDSVKWNKGPMERYYHLHPAYKNYPVVNITLEAANAYCNWLTDRYNGDEKRKLKKAQFFIPSEEQWTIIANGGNKNKMYPWENYYLRNKTGQFLCNFKRLGDQSITYDEATKEYKVVEEYQNLAGGLAENGFYTASVNSFEPVAPYGIHNMSGNVAEMITEKGIAKGGSYNSPGYDVRIQSRLNYKESSPEVGFRVFMKIISKD